MEPPSLIKLVPLKQLIINPISPLIPSAYPAYYHSHWTSHVIVLSSLLYYVTAIILLA